MSRCQEAATGEFPAPSAGREAALEAPAVPQRLRVSKLAGRSLDGPISRMLNQVMKKDVN